jgi:hypothetical protein
MKNDEIIKEFRELDRAIYVEECYSLNDCRKENLNITFDGKGHKL